MLSRQNFGLFAERFKGHASCYLLFYLAFVRAWLQIFLTASFLVLLPGNLQGRGRCFRAAMSCLPLSVKNPFYPCHLCSILFTLHAWLQIFLTAAFLVLLPGNLQGRGALLPG